MKTVFLIGVIFGMAAINQTIAMERELVRETQRLLTSRSTISRVDQNNNTPREPNRNSSSNSSASNSSSRSHR